MKQSVNRRHFLKLSSFTGGGLMLGLVLPEWAKATGSAADCESFKPSAYLCINKDNTVIVYVAKQEIGQGVNTSLPMLVAEELECDLKSIKVEIAPYGSLGQGAHDTGGSQSVMGLFDPMRKAGATARTMLIAAAAKRWNTGVEVCTAEKGKVVNNKTGASLSFGELVCDAAKEDVPKEVLLKNVKDFKVIGKGQKKNNLKDILTGKVQYGIDVKVPGMVYAAVARCPVMGGKLVSVDDSEALKIPGVVKVLRYEGTGAPMHVRAGVAVVATNSWAALRARKALKIVWDEAKGKGVNTAQLEKDMAARAKQKPAEAIPVKGNAADTIIAGPNSMVAEYSAPFVAHATLEPVNFTAQVKDGKCELWGGLQLPDWTVGLVAQELQIKSSDIKVNLTLSGGGFGRRLHSDFALEAVKLAKQLDHPVKVIWDRTDDIRFDVFRPANHHRLAAKWDAQGRITHWQHHVLTTSITRVQRPDAKQLSENLGGASQDFWYDIPNVYAGYSNVDFSINRGWVRGVEFVVNVFPLESFVDEVARKLKKDPLQYRLSMLEGRKPFEAKFNDNWKETIDPERMAGVLKLAADKIGWHKPAAKNIYRGIACHCYTTAKAYAAHAVEIEIKGPKQFIIKKVVATIDCGLVIDPDGLKNQMEGGTVFALSQALKSEIHIQDGKVVEDEFFNYGVLRYNEMPAIEVHVVPSEASPGGAGEVGLPTLAPALCNALAAAGNRPRRLPLQKDGYSWS